MMEYEEVPLAVRRWIEGEEWADSEEGQGKDGKDGKGKGKGKGLFAVLAKADVEKGEKIKVTATSAREKKGGMMTEEEEKEWRAKDKDRVVIFAPGAVYENAPLWVAEGSGCEGELSLSFFFLAIYRHVHSSFSTVCLFEDDKLAD